MQRSFFFLLALSHLVCRSVRVEGPCCRHLVAALHNPFFPASMKQNLKWLIGPFCSPGDSRFVVRVQCKCRCKCRTRNDCDVAINTTIAMNSSCLQVHWHSSSFPFPVSIARFSFIRFLAWFSYYESCFAIEYSFFFVSVSLSFHRHHTCTRNVTHSMIGYVSDEIFGHSCIGHHWPLSRFSE